MRLPKALRPQAAPAGQSDRAAVALDERVIDGNGVRALLKRGGNETGERVSAEAWSALRLTPHAVCPQWNHTLAPQPA
jgi:hypothetical protein